MLKIFQILSMTVNRLYNFVEMFHVLTILRFRTRYNDMIFINYILQTMRLYSIEKKYIRRGILVGRVMTFFSKRF